MKVPKPKLKKLENDFVHSDAGFLLHCPLGRVSDHHRGLIGSDYNYFLVIFVFSVIFPYTIILNPNTAAK